MNKYIRSSCKEFHTYVEFQLLSRLIHFDKMLGWETLLKTRKRIHSDKLGL